MIQGRSFLSGAAAALIVKPGATIIAEGTAAAPITFTGETVTTPDAVATWGGLIIMGNAPTNKGTQEVEGIEGHYYGGSDPTDSSGSLRYVRVWHGGSVIGQDNEINGITFAGVGSGTTCEYIEVAFNKDDGVEFFGGTVNCKYISVMFVGDDAIDTDEGYQGKMQFVSVLVSKDGHHGTEMDSKTGGDVNSQPRSHPQIYNALFVGSLQFAGTTASSDDLQPGLLRLREGTGGEFGNIILTNVGNIGVYQNQCGNEVRTHTKPASGYPDYLFFSANNIMHLSGGSKYKLVDDCDGLTDAVIADPALVAVPSDIEPTVVGFDPRPVATGPALESVDTVPADNFFQQTTYKGAFAPNEPTWLEKWSWLSEQNKLVAYNVDTGTDAKADDTPLATLKTSTVSLDSFAANFHMFFMFFVFSFAF